MKEGMRLNTKVTAIFMLVREISIFEWNKKIKVKSSEKQLVLLQATSVSGIQKAIDSSLQG